MRVSNAVNLYSYDSSIFGTNRLSSSLHKGGFNFVRPLGHLNQADSAVEPIKDCQRTPQVRYNRPCPDAVKLQRYGIRAGP